MALDRQSIEKRDFPVGRRGYQPDAVDEHLARLADEVDALRQSTRAPRAESVAGAASEQVRLIVEAAERSAEGIAREAERDAGEHLQRVSAAAAAMVERAAAVQSELGTLLESIRASAARVGQQLEALEATAGTLREEASPASVAVAEPAVVPPAPHIPVYDTGMLPGAPDFARQETDGEAEEASEAPPAAVATPQAAGVDEEGARLIALNMALNGTPREETERYLAENFELVDAEALLDDVYARAGQ